ncbi:MAG: hypothetical protein IH845_02505 [Nanoarchaeota archaeon]|nr:hypothetical protein [Nanoarchaeota archaeon]
MVGEMVGNGFRAYIAGSELYEKTDSLAREKLGKDSRAYSRVMYGVDTDKGTGSKFLFNTLMDQCLPLGQRVATLKDLEKIFDCDEGFLDGFHVDTSQIVLRTQTLSNRLNAYILGPLIDYIHGKGLTFSSENPLIISGLDFRSDDDPFNEGYGLRLNFQGGRISAENDKRLAHENYEGRLVPFGNGQKKIYTWEDGLSGICLSVMGNLGTGGTDLHESSEEGRVVIFEGESQLNLDY